MEYRYIDVLSDQAFKLVFTKASNKVLMISLLNGLLKGQENIADIEFGKNEHQGDTDEQGVVSFDILCTGANGEIFLIAIQRSKHSRFKERSIFYGARLISDQAPKDGMKEWKYELKKVYVIAILEKFTIEGSISKAYWHNICLCNSYTGTVFYDKLQYIYVELSNFVLKERELRTELEKWLYSLKHTGEMLRLPFYAKEPVFRSFFNTAEYAGLSKEEKEMIDFKLKNQWDLNLVMHDKYEEGISVGKLEGELKGKLEGKLETARGMKAEQLPDHLISKITGLSISEIKAL